MGAERGDSSPLQIYPTSREKRRKGQKRGLRGEADGRIRELDPLGAFVSQIEL